MKYIDADKLKYEIERRKLSNYYTDTDDYEAELLEIIDDLRQEQQEVDLEKEIEEYRMINEWSESIPLNLFKIIARYFYGLGQLNSK